MKILTLDKPKENAKPFTPELYVDDDVQMQPANQITVIHFFEENPNWVSHVQVTNGYISISRYGSPTVGLHVDDLVKILYGAFPDIHWPVRFEIQPQPNIRINPGETAVITVKVNSYKDFTLQWQQYDGKQKDTAQAWRDCAGCTSATFQTTAAGTYRCKGVNCRGESYSEQCQVHIKTPV